MGQPEAGSVCLLVRCLPRLVPHVGLPQATFFPVPAHPHLPRLPSCHRSPVPPPVGVRAHARPPRTPPWRFHITPGALPSSSIESLGAMWLGSRVGRKPAEEFPCSACSEWLPAEVRTPGLGGRASADHSRPPWVLVGPTPCNPSLALWRSAHLFSPVPSPLSGTVDPGLTDRHLEERTGVVSAFAFPGWGRKGAACATPLVPPGQVELGPLRLAYLYSWADTPCTGHWAKGFWGSKSRLSSYCQATYLQV